MTAGATLARAAGGMSGAIIVSRLTGFVRVLVVAGVLGTTFLGNTYQTANSIPNVVFELFAAGALQAVLVPGLVRLRHQDGDAEVERVSGSILGILLVLLGVLAVVGIVLAPLLARALFSGVDDPVTREAQIRLGTTWLRIFLPQTVFYGACLVASGVLNARERFVAPVAAPIVNNVLVIAVLGAFALLRGDAAPDLDLSGLESWMLAGGTTLAVVAFTAVPVVALWRSGFRLRPRFEHRDPQVRGIFTAALWASVQVASTQVLLVAALLLTNAVEGGVVAYQLGLLFFLLPHAVLSVPIVTTLFTALSRLHVERDEQRFEELTRRGMAVIAQLTLPVAAALCVLAWPLTSLVLVGERAQVGAASVAAAIAAFAPGIAAFGIAQLLTRALFALDVVRPAAFVHLGSAMLGVVVMVVAASQLGGAARIACVALVHSAAQVATAVWLGVLLRRHLGGARLLDPSFARSLLAAVATLAVMFAGSVAVDGLGQPDGVGDAAALVAGLGLLGLITFLGAGRVLHLPDPRAHLAVGDGS